MPVARIETGAARVPRVFAGERARLSEQSHVYVRATGAEFSLADLDTGRGEHEDRHDEDTDGHPDEEGQRRVDRRQHERRHRRDERGAHQRPQGWAECLLIDAGADVECGLLHYPHWVTETVDVPIIASDVPVYAHPGDAGADLTAAEAVRLRPGERATVATGVRIALPEGFVAFVVPRSGLAAKHGITVVNAPGTIDAGYRGEIKVILLNTDAHEPHEIAVGDRIAQIIVMPVPRARFIPVDTLPDSVRGEGGFGSTGYKKDGVLA